MQNNIKLSVLLIVLLKATIIQCEDIFQKALRYTLRGPNLSNFHFQQDLVVKICMSSSLKPYLHDEQLINMRGYVQIAFHLRSLRTWNSSNPIFDKNNPQYKKRKLKYIPIKGFPNYVNFPLITGVKYRNGFNFISNTGQWIHLAPLDKIVPCSLDPNSKYPISKYSCIVGFKTPPYRTFNYYIGWFRRFSKFYKTTFVCSCVFSPKSGCTGFKKDELFRKWWNMALKNYKTSGQIISSPKNEMNFEIKLEKLNPHLPYIDYANVLFITLCIIIQTTILSPNQSDRLIIGALVLVDYLIEFESIEIISGFFGSQYTPSRMNYSGLLLLETPLLVVQLTVLVESLIMWSLCSLEPGLLTWKRTVAKGSSQTEVSSLLWQRIWYIVTRKQRKLEEFVIDRNDNSTSSNDKTGREKEDTNDSGKFNMAAIFSDLEEIDEITNKDASSNGTNSAKEYTITMETISFYFDYVFCVIILCTILILFVHYV